MLTNNDLKQIRQIVKEEVKEEVQPVKASVENLDKKVAGLDKKVDGLDKKFEGRFESLEKKLDQAQEDISAILTVVIEQHDKLGKRVDRIENHLGLPKPQ